MGKTRRERMILGRHKYAGAEARAENLGLSQWNLMQTAALLPTDFLGGRPAISRRLRRGVLFDLQSERHEAKSEHHERSGRKE
jgi:hypothetical protein